MKLLNVVSVLVVSSTVACVSACGIVTVDGKPIGAAETESSAVAVSPPPKPVRPPPGMDCAAESASWLRLCRGTLPYESELYPGIGKTTSDDYIDISKRVIAYYKDNLDGGPGVRLPADVMQVVVRGALRVVHRRQIDEALVLLDEVTSLANGNVAANVGSTDEAVDEKFGAIAVALAGLITNGWTEFEPRMAQIREAAAAYPSSASSARAQAMIAEADAIEKRFKPAVHALREAQDKVEKDATRSRLIDEKNTLDQQADVIRDKLGLGSFDDGCDKHTPDPVDAQRLARLCPMARRVWALTAQIDAIERRYTDPVYKKLAIAPAHKPKR